MGCASIESPALRDASEITHRSLVPIYYALPPAFAWRSVGDVNVTANGDRAHLDELLADAEARAQHLGAEALIVREIRTDARYEPQTVWRSCGSTGMRGFGGTCPVVTNILMVVSRLEGTAIVRDPDAVAPGRVWRPPPPLGVAGSSVPHATSGSTLQDLDETFTQP